MPTLWIIGMMGSGKSTVGALVADRAGLPFVDLDAEIERVAAMTIPAIFYSEGEDGFRRRESAALEAIAGSRVVVACGGGAVISADNCRIMVSSGPVVWLQAPVATLAARVGDGSGRPLVSEDARSALAALLEERSAAYDEAATIAFDADRPAPIVAGEVAAWLKRS